MSITVEDAVTLSSSWLLALRAERKFEQTRKTYADGLRFYLAWCTKTDVPPLCARA